ncbi:MAG: hypothetical protein AAF804_05930, partial [Bacteroidota bacterium]
GDCGLATIADLAHDLERVREFVATQEEGFEKIGVLGISAGGWTMAKAEETVDFDFMISVVGPSTSVRDQQLQSASYGADVYQLSPEAKENLLAYTRLMFDAEPTSAGLEAMESTLAPAQEEGWRELLEDTDIPTSEEEIATLWVRRHDFDPREVLEKYPKPFLAIYGERDWIVPQKENIARLEEYFQGRDENLTTVNAYNAEHGMEMEAGWIELDQNQSYWHFYRISPQVRMATVAFLRKHDLVK